MRLMFVTQDFPPHLGGLQTYSLRVAEQLARRCERFVVVAPRIEGWREVDAGLDFEVIRVPSTTDLVALVGAPVFAKLIGTRDIDTAFHAQWQTTPASALLRRSGALRRLCVAAHGRELLTGPPPRRRLARGAFDLLRRACLASADALFPVSANTAQLLRDVGGVDPQRIVVVNNGADPTRRFRVDAGAWRRARGLGDARLIVSLGRLVPNKGFDRVIEAMPSILARSPDTVYVIGGTGPDGARLRELAEALGVAEQVEFIGRVPDEELNAFYSAAEVFATISREAPPAIEGFGIVFLEAAACETPAVAGRSGGIPDAVLDGETGLLVDPDRAQDVAGAILALLEDPARARAMGQRGRRRVVEELNWPTIGARLAELLADTGRTKSRHRGNGAID